MIYGCKESQCATTGGSTKSYIDAFYMSCITLTTVGFGDVTPKSRTGRIVGIFWMISGVIATTNLMLQVSSRIKAWAMEQRRIQSISRDNFDRLDKDGDGVLTKFEFVAYMLVQNGVVTEADIKALEKQFDRMDMNGDRHLSFEEITNFESRLRSHSEDLPVRKFRGQSGYSSVPSDDKQTNNPTE